MREQIEVVLRQRLCRAHTIERLNRRLGGLVAFGDDDQHRPAREAVPRPETCCRDEGRARRVRGVGGDRFGEVHGARGLARQRARNPPTTPRRVQGDLLVVEQVEAGGREMGDHRRLAGARRPQHQGGGAVGTGDRTPVEVGRHRAVQAPA